MYRLWNLFGNFPLSNWARVDETMAEPWRSFGLAQAAFAAGAKNECISMLRGVLATPDLESLAALQTWHFLRDLGVQPSPNVAKTLLGLVVEVEVSAGTNILAAYADYTATAYTCNGIMRHWRRPNNSLDLVIGTFLRAGEDMLTDIALPEDTEPADLPTSWAQFHFLTPIGRHSTRGYLITLDSNALSGSVLKCAVDLKQQLSTSELCESKL